MILQMDLAILDFIRANIWCAFLDGIMPIITLFGESGLFWIILTLVLLAVPRTRPLGLCTALALILELLACNVLLKPLVARPRPWNYRPELAQQILIALPTDYSFPSGHTAGSIAAASAMALCKEPRAPWAVLLAVLVGLSRLYLCVHFFSDVLCGALLGLLCGWAGTMLGKWIRQRRTGQSLQDRPL